MSFIVCNGNNENGQNEGNKSGYLNAKGDIAGTEKDIKRSTSPRRINTGTKNKVSQPLDAKQNGKSNAISSVGNVQSSTAKKDGKKSFKSVTKANVLGDMSDAFAQYVQQNLNQQGFRDLSEEEQRVIYNAIKATLTENKVLETFQTPKPVKSTEKSGSKKKRRHSSNKAP